MVKHLHFKLDMIARFVFIFALLPALTWAEDDCESRLRARAASLFNITKEALTKSTLTRDQAERLLAEGELQNPFVNISQTAAVPMFRRAFDGLIHDATSAEIAAFKTLLQNHLAARQKLERVRDAAFAETAHFIDPHVVDSKSHGDLRDCGIRIHTTSTLEGRPVMTDHMMLPGAKGYVEYMYDFFNPDPTKRTVRLPSARIDTQLAGAPTEIGGKPHFFSMEGQVAIDLATGENIFSSLKVDDYLRGHKHDPYAVTVDGTRFSVWVGETARDVYVVDLDHGAAYKPFPSTDLGHSEPVRFETPKLFSWMGVKYLAVAVHAKEGFDRSIAVFNLETHALVKVLNEFKDVYITSLGEFEFEAIRGEPWLYVRERYGPPAMRGPYGLHRVLLVNALTGEAQRFENNSPIMTEIAAFTHMGHRYFIWGGLHALTVFDPVTGKAEAFSMPYDVPTYISPFEYQGVIYAFVLTHEGAELVQLTRKSD